MEVTELQFPKKETNSNWWKPPPIAVLAVAVYVGHRPSPFWQWLLATAKKAMGGGLRRAIWRPLPKGRWVVAYAIGMVVVVSA